MRTIAFTDFRKRASGFITAVEHGEVLIFLRRGKPVAEITTFQDAAAWELPGKKPGLQLEIKGCDLSYAILEEREHGS